MARDFHPAPWTEAGGASRCAGRGLLWAGAVALGLLAALALSAAVRAAQVPDARSSAPDISGLLTSPENPWDAEVLGEDSGRNLREAPVRGRVFGGRLCLALKLGAKSAEPVRASVYLVDKNGGFYKSAEDFLLTHLREQRVVLDLGPDSKDFVPAGSARPFSPAGGAPVVRVGVGLYSREEWAGPVEITEAAIEGGGEPAIAGGAPRIEGLSIAPARPCAGQMVELAFGFPVAPANPFDPSWGRLDAEVAGPGGPLGAVPAFFDQEYLPLREGFEQRCVAVGPPRWKVRLRPEAPGQYRVKLRWQDSTLAELSLAVGPAVGDQRLAPVRPEELERLAAVGDEPLLRRLPARPGRGGAVLAGGRFRPAPADVGELCGWIAPLEWTAEWGGWLGAGRYNLEMAWKLDRVLDRAAERGVRLPLFLNYDGPLGEGDKYRWQFNPLRAELGGPLTAVGQYFRNERARADAVALFRYLAARYANHPAVAGLVLAATLGAEGTEDWHEAVAAGLADLAGSRAAGCRVTSLHPLAIRQRKSLLVGSFEPGAPKGWRFDTEIAPKTQAGYSTEMASEGRQSLRIQVDFPGEVCMFHPLDEEIFNVGEYDFLSFDLFVPRDAPGNLRAMVYLRDRELCWYQQLLDDPLRPGDWTRLALDLRPGRNGLAGLGHSRPWEGYSRQRLRAFGVRVFADARYNRTYQGAVFLDNVRFLGEPEVREEEPALAILNFSEDNARNPQLFTRVEYSFDLNRTFANPFDPECVEVRARVLTPSGQLYTCPGFWYQGYRRVLDKELVIQVGEEKRKVASPDGVERLEPDGGSVWKVRLAAAEPGAHQVTIEVLVPDGKGGMAVAAARKGLAFEAVAGPVPGYVRTAADGRHFEHSSGEFYYPIGMAMRSPSDARDLDRDEVIRKHIQGDSPVSVAHGGGYVETIDFLAQRGTWQFDDYLEKCGKSGVNWARVWMCPWWLGLEWDHRYPGYEGSGRYNLANAWRMDHVVEQAEKAGVYLQLCLLNHGQVTTRIDRQWDFNPNNLLMPRQLWNHPDREADPPFYKRPGGLVDTPRDWFTDARTRKLVRQRLRYTVARWGYSPKIMSWGLMSEIEFTGGSDFATDHSWDGRPYPLQTEWHREMARYLRTIDPYRHLVTTHFSHPGNGLNDIWRLTDLDYVQSNAYSSFRWLGGGESQGAIVGASAAMYRYYHGFPERGYPGLEALKRPVLIGEWGGFHMHNSRQVLDSELHAGLWAQAMTPMAGATGWWWWLHVHFRDRYGEFAALSRFMKGEDLRGVIVQLDDERSRTARAIAPPGAARGLKVLGIGDGRRRAYAWVCAAFDPDGRPERDKDKLTYDGARLELDRLVPGVYEVEFWDPAKGERVSGGQFLTRGGPLPVLLPRFKGDLAVKVRWKSEPTPGTEAPRTPQSQPPSRAATPATPPPSTPARERSDVRLHEDRR